MRTMLGWVSRSRTERSRRKRITTSASFASSSLRTLIATVSPGCPATAASAPAVSRWRARQTVPVAPRPERLLEQVLAAYRPHVMRSLLSWSLPGPPGHCDSARLVRPTVVPSYKHFGPSARCGLVRKTHVRGRMVARRARSVPNAAARHRCPDRRRADHGRRHPAGHGTQAGTFPPRADQSRSLERRSAGVLSVAGARMHPARMRWGRAACRAVHLGLVRADVPGAVGGSRAAAPCRAPRAEGTADGDADPADRPRAAQRPAAAAGTCDVLRDGPRRDRARGGGRRARGLRAGSRRPSAARRRQRPGRAVRRAGAARRPAPHAGRAPADGRRGAVPPGPRPASPSPRPAARAPAQLRVVAGPDAGGVHLLHGGQIRIGRSADADVPLDDPDVSRLHCAVTVATDGRVSWPTCGSTNGTTLDGTARRRRARCRCAPGALLRIGESALRLQPRRAHRTPPLPTAPDGEGHLRVTPGRADGPARPADGGGARRAGRRARGATGAPGRTRAASGGGRRRPGVRPRPDGAAPRTARRSRRPAPAPARRDGGTPRCAAPPTGYGAPAAPARATPRAAGTPSRTPHRPRLRPHDRRRRRRRRHGPGAPRTRADAGPAAARSGPTAASRRWRRPTRRPVRAGAAAASAPGRGGWPAAGPPGGRTEPTHGVRPADAAAARAAPEAPGARGAPGPAADDRWPDPAAVLLTALGPGPAALGARPGHPDALDRAARHGRPRRDGRACRVPVTVESARGRRAGPRRAAGAAGRAGPLRSSPSSPRCTPPAPWNRADQHGPGAAAPRSARRSGPGSAGCRISARPTARTAGCCSRTTGTRPPARTAELIAPAGRRPAGPRLGRRADRGPSRRGRRAVTRARTPSSSWTATPAGRAARDHRPARRRPARRPGSM